MKQWWVWLLLLISPGVLAKSIRIGLSVSLTGNFAQLGQLELEGLQLWAHWVNSHGGIRVGQARLPVKLFYLDDQSSPTVSTELTQKLITEDHVDFLIGPYSSGITQATTAIAERYGILTIAPLANAPSLYSRGFKDLFGVLPLATQYLEGVLRLAHSFKPEPTAVAILTPNNIFSLAAAEGARSYAQKLGMKVVAYEVYPSSLQDFSALLSQIQGLHPEIVLGTGYLNDSIQIVKQMAQLGFSPKVLAFTIATSVPDFARSLGSLANGIMGGEWWEPTFRYPDPVFGSNQAFVQLFKKTYGEVPTYYSTAGAVAGELLELAIERAGSLSTQAVRKALLSLRVTTLFGPIHFAPNEVNQVAVSAVSQIQNGMAVPIYPPQAATAKPIYPKPPF
jgi:branched-chain amino acid transport system substrate-binding protein